MDHKRFEASQHYSQVRGLSLMYQIQIVKPESQRVHKNIRDELSFVI